jgi:putative membrane protein
VDIPKPTEKGKAKAMGEFLGVTFAESNPRKRIKRSKKPLGNLSLEILNHLSCYVHSIIENETLKIGLYQNQASMSSLSSPHPQFPLTHQQSQESSNSTKP